MDAYEKIIIEISKYPKNHYRSLGLQKTVNLHISGLKVTAHKMKNTNVGRICAQEANRYQRLLDAATSR